MSNTERKLKQIFDEWFPGFKKSIKAVIKAVKDSYTFGKTITKVFLLLSSIGLAISYVMLILGIIVSSPFIVFLSALLATVIFFALWKAPMIVSDIIYETIGQLPLAGKPTRGIYNLVTPIFLVMLNLSFIASFISVMVLIVGLDALSFKDYCIICASSLFFFIFSEFSYTRVVVWRHVLVGLVVVFLAAHIFMQIYPNTIKELGDDVTDDNQEVIIKKGAIMYRMNGKEIVPTDTAKEDLMARVLSYKKDDKTKDKIYHLIYSVNKISFANGVEVFVPSQSIRSRISENDNSENIKKTRSNSRIEKLGKNKVRVFFTPDEPIKTGLEINPGDTYIFSEVTAPFKISGTAQPYYTITSDIDFDAKKYGNINIYGAGCEGSVVVEVKPIQYN